MIHGFSGDAGSFASIREVVGEEDDLRNADLFAPALPFGRFSSSRPAAVVATILDQIDRCVTRRDDGGSSYRRIYLIGHSMGGLFARKTYVCAVGSHPDAPIEPRYDQALESIGAAGCDTPRLWASRVDRIVLLAALNRGWSISHHLGIRNIVLLSVGSFVGRVLTFFSGEEPLVFAMRKGRPFVAQLRIQWIRMRQRARASNGAIPGSAVTVQLLGSIDDMVSPEDSVDVVSGRDFYYMDVPESSHVSILQMSDQSPGASGRREHLLAAMTHCSICLERDTIPPVDEYMTVRGEVTDVVFVIHGIRDYGYWTQKIARRAIAFGAAEGRTVVSETSTYGYFPMLPFIWPRTRRKKVEWLMDEYAEAVARYPNAKFAYMGHSNGTYMLARSLEDYPVVRFTYVVFAGSVVPTDYNWAMYIAQGRIDGVLNYTASADEVVAFFPKLFQRPRWQDLGSAGHDGFDQAATEPDVYQLGPIAGGHSAARQEPEWDAIARFLLDGGDVTASNLAPRRNRLVAALGAVPILVWLFIVVLLLGGGWLVLQIPSETVRVLAAVGYVWFVWKVLTRV